MARTLVEADLSTPGAIATADQIGPDQALIEDAQQPRPVDDGGVIDTGFPFPYRMNVRCGIVALGELNGIEWATGVDPVPVPLEWADLVEPDSQTIIVEVLVTPGPDPTVTATANGHSVTYRPVTPPEIPPCE